MFKITKDTVALVVAILAILGFSLFLYHMLGLTKVEETEWTRAVYLLSGVEAIVYAAVGYLFGKDVNRERAENAEKRAEEGIEAQKRAVELEIKGKNIVDLFAREMKRCYREDQLKVGIQDAGRASNYRKEQLDELVNYAKSQFP